MSSSLPSHPRPRPRTAPLQSSNYARRRTSQTFRPSPLAGPVLSYASLSKLDTSSTSHETSYSSSASSSEGSNERMIKFKRCASTGALAPLSEDGLQPPMPARTRSSRRSVVFAGPSAPLSQSSSTPSKNGTPTLSSLISLSLSEEPRPHGLHSTDSYHLDARNALDLEAPHFLPYRLSSEHSDFTISSATSGRHSRRLSCSPSFLDSSVRASSANSLRSATSVSSMATRSDDASKRDGVDVKCDGRRVRIKELKMENDDKATKSADQRRRLSLVASVEKHDWLTATPTPIFSRSGLRTQGVIMPIPARKQQREQELCRSGSNRPDPKCFVTEKQARDKGVSDQDRPKGDKDEKARVAKDRKEQRNDSTESKLKSSKSLSSGVPRRRSIFRVASFASPAESPKRTSITKEDSSEASETENTVMKFDGEFTRSSESSPCFSPSPSEFTPCSDLIVLTLPSTHSSSATSLPTSASSLGSVDTPSTHPDEENLAKSNSNSNSKSDASKELTRANLDEKRHPTDSSLSSSRSLTLLGVLRKLTIRKSRRTEKTI